ncbi:hypothetical protein [Streptomyces sp. NPDC059906]|uniref:hypothetical protein n=1 Tax=Streptomyces sp. NPDC059906 TaxID=3346997 RepID=UPI0036477F58
MSARDARARRLARLAAQVDWSKVVDPYTGERYGPEMPHGLWAADPATAGRTCETLHYVAVGDGSSVRGAAAEMLPFLVAAARDAEVTVRFAILRTIAGVARTGNTAPTAKVEPLLEGRWRPTVDATWPDAWERASAGLLPLLDADDDMVRAGAVDALAQAAAHADSLVTRFATRFDDEPVRWVAQRLVLGVGELARHAAGHREEALAWLRHRMTVSGKDDEEPDVCEDVDAWIAWDEEIRHDVRLEAVEALRRALPGYADPRYARVTTDALLASRTTSDCPPAEYRSSRVGVITEADRRLGADLPGRLALAHTLLHHVGPAEREGGLEVAASLMSRWRSAVPALLPAVAGLVDDRCPENRVLALRVLAMCGTAARPWAGLVATRLTAADEPHGPAREYAVRALSRMGDDRCVPHLTELLAVQGGFAHRPTGSADGRSDRDDVCFTEALASFAAHSGTLLDPLLAHLKKAGDRWHPYWSVLRRWHRDGARIVPRMIELLDAEETLMIAAYALLRSESGAVAAAHRERLRERVELPAGPHTKDLAHISPFDHLVITGDDEPVRALLRRLPNGGGFPVPGPRLPESVFLHACATLGGEVGAPGAGRLREMFHAALSRKPARWSDAPNGAVERARALWRVTGDADDVLPGLLELTAHSAMDVYQTPGGVAALELLAEVAATHPPVAERVAGRLRATATARITHDNRFDAMRAVRSLWRLTSDPRQVVPALAELVRICPPPGSAAPTVLDPLRLLAEVGAAAPASVARVVPALHALLGADERPVHHDGRRAVRDDDALCAAIRAVLDAGAAKDGTAGTDAGGRAVP